MWKEKAKQYLNMWRIIPVYLLIQRLRNHHLIYDEQNIWMQCKGWEISGVSRITKLWMLLKNEKDAYRNCLLFRVSENRGMTAYFCKHLLQMLFPPMNTLYINTEKIGKGFLVNHGFSTIITAEKIGRNVLISQQVTIGVKEPDGKKPVIGDNVKIYAGAKILGGITLGNGCIVGANAVVINDVPPKTVVGGGTSQNTEILFC